MSIAHILILLATGLVAGFGGGFLGLGGASIMTPVQYIVFTQMGVPAGVAVKLAFGTSLLVILPTAISGAWRHHQLRAVRWKPALFIGLCSLFCAFGGASLATYLPGVGLRIGFGVFMLAVAIRMLTFREPQSGEKLRDNPWLWVGLAVPIGFLSGLLGIGGGTLMVPLLVLVLGFGMHTAIATSLAAMIFISTGGVIGYLINGLGSPDLPPYSLGYINLPAWFMLSITSVGMAQLGTLIAHKLPARTLRYVFATLVLYMGLRMTGLFEWLGWPL